MEKEDKIRFKDLSVPLKIVVVAGWILTVWITFIFVLAILFGTLAAVVGG